MPIARCPKCGGRQLIDAHVVGQSVACIKCEKSFVAQAQGGFRHLGEILVACSAIAAGIAASWYFIRPH
jgi:uncharacterized protein (DUF983 family)